MRFLRNTLILSIFLICNGCACIIEHVNNPIPLTEEQKQDRIRSWTLPQPNPWIGK